MTLGIDEVNTISIEEEIKKYFSVMDITKKQKEEREEAAKDLFPIFLFLFALLGYAEEYDLPYEYVLMQFRMQFGSVAYQYYDDAEEYIDFLTKQVLDATLKDNSTLTLKDGEHWVSPERALELSENEANSLLNYQELKNAIQQGKTHKTWVTERDNRVRDDHREMEGNTIPIMEYFHFPDCDMLCPHDVVNGTAKQNSGCRCSCHYYNMDNNDISTAENKEDIIESEAGNRGKFQDTLVNRRVLNARTVPVRLAVLGEDEETTAQLSERTMEILRHRTGTRWEDLSFVNSVTHESMINRSYNYYSKKRRMSQCKASEEMEQMWENSDKGTIIAIHNHPSSSKPSYKDIEAAFYRKYKYGLVIGHNGKIFQYFVSDDAKISKANAITIERALDKYGDSVYNGNTNEKERALVKLNMYGVDIREIP